MENSIEIGLVTLIVGIVLFDLFRRYKIGAKILDFFNRLKTKKSSKSKKNETELTVKSINLLYKKVNVLYFLMAISLGLNGFLFYQLEFKETFADRSNNFTKDARKYAEEAKKYSLDSKSWSNAAMRSANAAEEHADNAESYANDAENYASDAEYYSQ